jgi:membrane-bound lytic murein transglycosylase D
VLGGPKWLSELGFSVWRLAPGLLYSNHMSANRNDFNRFNMRRPVRMALPRTRDVRFSFMEKAAIFLCVFSSGLLLGAAGFGLRWNTTVVPYTTQLMNEVRTVAVVTIEMIQTEIIEVPALSKVQALLARQTTAATASLAAFPINDLPPTTANSPAPNLQTENQALAPKINAPEISANPIEDENGALFFDKSKILADSEGRISSAFHIPENMQSRVAFWFDVYTKYSSDERVIHHQKYPWVVFKVIDVAPIIYAAQPAHRWLRNVKADKLVSSETNQIRGLLKKIAHRKTMDNLSSQEQDIVNALSILPGNIQKRAAEAARMVRVQTGQKDFFEEGLSISPQYLGEMEKIFAAHNLPTELTRLPFVESSFNHTATSKVGASGIWQIVDKTGRKFLKVGAQLDERRSPYKATETAALLLTENHLILRRSWPLAITAYNHGPAGVRKAMKAARSEDLAKIIERYQTASFNFASSNYYTEFLAALYAEKYQREIFGVIETEQIPETQIVMLSHRVRTAELLRRSGLSAEELLSQNPELKTALQRNALLPKGFRIHVPVEKKKRLDELFASAINEKTSV